MTRQELIIWCIKSLRVCAKGKTYWGDLRGFQAFRWAGGLEALLVEEGFLDPKKQHDIRQGGKCWIPGLLDFRWHESLPEYMLRKGEEYAAGKGLTIS